GGGRRGGGGGPDNSGPDNSGPVDDGPKPRRGGETAATKAGREAHKAYNPGPTYDTKYTLPSGKRPDAVDFENKIVRELKPNNPRAIRRGERQVEGYRQELEQVFGPGWTSYVDTY
ncbi:MAG TPA: hypothetical protein VN228_04165, partial [Pyrinomonadaceae bacterium]|nr:hypothetical protein [Pyrinomonadaceae bacterium]